jgi:hypothetical protein
VSTALAVALLVLAVGIGGCGGDDETSSTTTTSTSTDETGLPEQPCPKAESPPNIINVVSYGAACEAVEDAMSQLQSVSKQFRIGDFECTRSSGTRLSGTWECKGEASYFTFEFGD